MTKKDYIKFASMLKTLRYINEPLKGDAYRVWKSAVIQTAGIFADDNSNFNHARFYEACGYED